VGGLSCEITLRVEFELSGTLHPASKKGGQFIDQEMLIYKTGGKVQKFHTFSTVLLFPASGGAFVVIGLDTGFWA